VHAKRAELPDLPRSTRLSKYAMLTGLVSQDPHKTPELAECLALHDGPAGSVPAIDLVPLNPPPQGIAFPPQVPRALWSAYTTDGAAAFNVAEAEQLATPKIRATNLLTVTTSSHAILVTP